MTHHHHRLYTVGQERSPRRSWPAVMAGGLVLAMAWAIAATLIYAAVVTALHGYTFVAVVTGAAAALMGLLALSWWPQRDPTR